MLVPWSLFPYVHAPDNKESTSMTCLYCGLSTKRDPLAITLSHGGKRLSVPEPFASKEFNSHYYYYRYSQIWILKTKQPWFPLPMLISLVRSALEIWHCVFLRAGAKINISQPTCTFALMSKCKCLSPPNPVWNVWKKWVFLQMHRHQYKK